jgi:hypothetical protein
MEATDEEAGFYSRELGNSALVEAPISPGSVQGVLVEGYRDEEGRHQTLISFVGVDLKRFWPVTCCLCCRRDDPPWFKVSKNKMMLWARLSFVLVFIGYNVYQMVDGETKVADGILNVVIAIFLFFTQSSFSGIIKAHTYKKID